MAVYSPLRPAVRAARSADYLKARISYLHQLWAPHRRDRIRIRDLLNGGRPAVVALLGEQTKYRDQDLPAANFVDSGLERMAQKLGHAPDIKIDPPLGQEGPRHRYNADVLIQVVSGFDEMQRLELQLPNQARWLPGYGFCVWTISQHQDPYSGYWYPVGRIRNAFDCYPGSWNADEDPTELAVTRIIDRDTLAARYPTFAAYQARRAQAETGISLSAATPQGAWGLVPADGCLISEFYDETGCYMYEHESGLVLDYWPNPVEKVPFVVVRRFTFDQLHGQFQHVIGLMAMLAKLNILAFLATEDATFRETNIIGDITQNAYKRGRFAVNHFPPGTTIQKPPVDAHLFQAWQQIDRLERHFRVGGNYPVTADAESPTSFTTGQGLTRLNLSYEENITEYQLSLKYGLQALDALRLCWDERLYAGLSKPMYCSIDGEARTGSYDPARIKGWYLTRRVYGMMAAWDEPQKIVGGLQLRADKIIDRQTFQENLYGLSQLSRINERILRDDTREFLMTALAQRASQGDPAAIQAFKKIMAAPREIEAVLDEVFPDTPPPSAAAPPGMPGAPGAAGGAGGLPPDVTTILSRLEGGGEMAGGAQTVATI